MSAEVRGNEKTQLCSSYIEQTSQSAPFADKSELRNFKMSDVNGWMDNSQRQKRLAGS